MNIDFNMQGLSFYGTLLPLDPSIEEGFSSWLPERLHKASKKRQQEFLAGRFCAVRAANKIGFSLASLPQANSREPIWPTDIIGSISHSNQMALGCVAYRDNYKSVGMDAEEIVTDKQMNEISHLVLTREEAKRHQSLISDKKFHFTLIFSAKESLFKALYPLCRCFIDFHDAEVSDVDLENKTFCIELKGETPDLRPFTQVYRGYFSVLDQTIITVIPILY